MNLFCELVAAVILVIIGLFIIHLLFRLAQLLYFFHLENKENQNENRT